MPIDPNIVSGLAPAAANMAQMGTFAQQQTAMEAHRKNQEERRKEQELRDILSSAPDDDAAIDALNKRGYAEYASKLRTQLDGHRKSVDDAFLGDLKNDQARVDLLARTSQGIKDQATLDTAKMMFTAFGEEGQKLATMLPAQWDDAAPSQLQSFIEKGLQTSDYTKQQIDAYNKLMTGDYDRGAAELFATADTPEEAQGVLAMLQARRAPKAIIDRFAPLVQNWGPDAQNHVADMALTEQQRRTLAGQDATRTATAERAATDDERMAASAAEAARHNRVMEARPTGGGGQSGGDTGDAKAIAAAIISGDQPPSLTGLYRFAGPVRAELARKGYDLTRATEDWTATQKHLNTLNGAQQTRLRQAVSFTQESIPLIRDLVKQWDSSGLPFLSKANLEAAAKGTYGPKQQSLANRLKGQIADLTSELGTVYKGGNSSTDESLKLAAQNLSADWSKKAALDALDQIEKNLQFRANSIKNTGPIGGRENNPYAPEASSGTPAAERSVTMAELEQIAKMRKTTVEQEKARAAAAGYVVR